jgi:hypothetical protein
VQRAHMGNSRAVSGPGGLASQELNVAHATSSDCCILVAVVQKISLLTNSKWVNNLPMQSKQYSYYYHLHFSIIIITVLFQIINQ